MEDLGAAWTWRPVGRALLFLYLPQLLPLFVGPLTECSHCVASYWQLFVVLPGMVVRVLLASPSVLAYWMMIVVTLAWLLAFVGLFQRRSPPRSTIAAGLAILSGLNALGVSFLLRM